MGLESLRHGHLLSLKGRYSLDGSCLLLWDQAGGMDAHLGCAKTRQAPHQFFRIQKTSVRVSVLPVSGPPALSVLAHGAGRSGQGQLRCQVLSCCCSARPRCVTAAWHGRQRIRCPLWGCLRSPWILSTAPGLAVREQPAAAWPPGKDPWRGHCQGWGRGLNFSLNFSPLLGAAWGSYPGTGLCEAGSSAAGRENTLNALFHFFPLLFHQALCSAAYLQCRLSSDFPCCFHYHKFIPPGEVSWGCVECKKRKAR